MFRTTVLITVLALCCALWAPANAAETGDFLFFGIVTVRHGKTVFIQNPKLSEEQATKCQKIACDALELDRAFTTTKNAKGELTYTWGDDEDELTEEGLVPYVAYFATPDQYIPLEEWKAEPRKTNMGSWTSSVPGLITVGWWAPETTEQCSLHLEFYDEAGYNTVATLKGDTIAVGASGTSPDGVSWEIASIEEQDYGVVASVVTDKGPEGHAFVFRVSTTKFEDPHVESPWAKETEDGKKLVYDVTFWADSKDQLACLEIRERHPDRITKWELKDFPLGGE